MLIKIGIIVVAIIGAIVIFPNEISGLFPDTSTKIIDATKNDLGKITDSAIEKTQMTIGEGGKLVNNEVKDFTKSSSESLTDKISQSLTESINNISESAQQTIGLGGILGDNQNNEPSVHRTSSSQTSYSSESQTTSPSIEPVIESTIEPVFTSTTTETQTTHTFETLSLESSQQSNDQVMLHYEDTSGKTNSVSVTLRTTEKELFTGIFYSSMFEAFVEDISHTAYFIDMVIEHEEYGTITSSVFNPADDSDTVINGVFSES